MDNIVTDLGRRRFAIGFVGLTAALLLPGARPAHAASLPAPSDPIARRFNVFWDKDAIGVHQIKITPAAFGAWDVQVDIDLRFDLGLFGAIDYRHASQERWRDGRIVALEARTDDDGKVAEVTGRASGRSFRLEGPEGMAEAPGNLLTSNCAWSEAICHQSEIIDATGGTVVGLVATPEGSYTTITASGREMARAYQVSCPMIAGSFWYDAAGLWMRGRLVRQGEKIDYFLDT
jgi:hypothetical protein